MWISKSKRTLLSLSLIAAMSGSLLVACNNKADNSSAATSQPAANEATKENITLHIGIWEEKLKDTITESVEIYKMDHPNVNVELTVTPIADYYTKLQTSLLGEEGPDLFLMNGPNFYKFASLDLLADLQPNIDNEEFDTSVYPKGITELYQYSGKQYGIPYFQGTIGLFYNKDLFDKAKIPYPDDTWTWDTLKTNAAKLTNKEQKIYGYIAPNDPQSGYYPYIYQAGGAVISSDHLKSGLDQPEAQSAIQFMKDFMDQGISPTAQQQLETKPVQLFGSGKAAILPGGSYDASTLHGMLGDKLGVAELPAGKQKGYLIHGSSWVINSKSKNQQEAWELIKILSGKEGQDLLAKSAFNYPTYKGSVDLWLQSIPALDMEAFVRNIDQTGPYPVSKNTSAWQNVLSEQVTSALTGKVPVKKALDEAAAQMNELLAQEQ
ncbi:sugar ABC transporter substrate-binding protein [Paenibacillus illinoisensis]|uniref:ABC transporter substrate-binding protein n=1 Tax=Paenibacillus illinoisensis TaxID=59845 RepID=UPI003D279874